MYLDTWFNILMNENTSIDWRSIKRKKSKMLKTKWKRFEFDNERKCVMQDRI
jgi:hypothetical protein